MQVRAKCNHLQPPMGRYRTEGEEFEHSGPLYKHVEAVEVEAPARKAGKAKKDADADE